MLQEAEIRMTKKKKRRKSYSREFKRAAVKQVLEGQRGVAEIADSLGIARGMLHGWKQKFLEEGSVAFPGNGVPAPPRTPEQEEIARLRLELADAQQDIAILKKAAAYFAKNSD